MGRSESEQGKILPIFKGILLTVILNLALVLIFAFIVKISLLSQGVIRWVNQFLKIIALFIGVFFCVSQNKGFVKGGIVGMFSSVTTTLIFALLGGESQTFLVYFLDTLFCGIVGGIIGVIAVNRK